MTRHASVHAAGVVIAPKAITEYAPLYKGARDEITTQWSMKEIERIGLLKMDFLGLSTLTLIFDAIEEIKRTTGVELDIDALPLDDRQDLPDFPGRADLRHLPVREQRHARHPPQGEAAAARRSDRAERALPAGTAAQRHGRRLHRPQTGQDRGEVRAAAARADPGGHLRRHRLSGTGDAHLERACRVLARRGRPAAQGDGEEEPRGDGEDARQVPGGRAEERPSTRRRPPTSSN